MWFNNMKIGIVTTWYERGAAYVSKAYADLLSTSHDIYIYVRDGEYDRSSETWGSNKYDVTHGWKLHSSDIHFGHIQKWIKRNELDILFFNEQRDFGIILKIKEKFPNIVIGSYIDYYTQDMIGKFRYYDFVICNTKRHYSVFKDITDCFYVPWGCDTSVFTPIGRKKNDQIVFFHSVGMSMRKGTKVLIDTFINYELYRKSKLVVHTQIDIYKVTGYKFDELKQYGIEVIEKTVGAPGLYTLGDVYVYPTTLDGLGLTIYEALASGMPVITTDYPPMNEIVNELVGRLVKVERTYTRSDAYYWPLTDVEANSLYEGMNYYIENFSSIEKLQNEARDYAVERLEWKNRERQIKDIFETVKVKIQNDNIKEEIKKLQRESANQVLMDMFAIMPDWIEYIVKKRLNG